MSNTKTIALNKSKAKQPRKLPQKYLDEQAHRRYEESMTEYRKSSKPFRK